jgi:ABC-type glycerol-3-phosphate transport system substrate-binding protein
MTQLSHIFPMAIRRLLVLFLPFVLLLTACDYLAARLPGGGATPSPAATAANGLLLDAATLSPQATAELAQPPQPAPPSTLRVWIPPEIGARTEAGFRELTSQVRAFETTHDDLSVVIEQKPLEGPGGIISYLRTGRTVAPSVMPDLVAVSGRVLADANTQDLFIPLDDLVDPAILGDIYPAAVSQMVTDGRLYGYPFATTGLTHLVYRPSQMTGDVPLTWAQFISDTNHTLVLPADSREGALFGLQFYLAEGGALINDAGQPDLQSGPLAQALSQIGLRKDNLLQSSQLKTLDEAWQYHQLGLSQSMWMQADFLLGQQTEPAAAGAATDQAYMPVPGPGEALTPLTTTWAWAITTTDQSRQALAAELLGYLTRPENLTNWSSRSQVLPAQRSPMEQLAAENAYYQFAGEELQRAAGMPVSETSRLLDALGDAVFQVLTTDRSPAVIAEEVILAARQ